MRILVTGSAGHLGEALMRVLGDEGHDIAGLDVVASAHTTVVESIVDRDVVRECVRGADAILHAATLHKPHVGSHDRQAFVDTNSTGTLTCSTRRWRPASGASSSRARQARSAGRSPRSRPRSARRATTPSRPGPTRCAERRERTPQTRGRAPSPSCHPSRCVSTLAPPPRTVAPS